MLPSTFIGFWKGLPIGTCVLSRNEKSELKYQLIAAVQVCVASGARCPPVNVSAGLVHHRDEYVEKRNGKPIAVSITI